MEYAEEMLAVPEIADALARIHRLTAGWRANEERAAATLAINVTTTPFDVRERLLAVLLRLVGVDRAGWEVPLRAPGADIVPAAPRDAFLQLIDRERTYLSNVPVDTPVSRVCRALVRLGVLDRVAAATTLEGLRRVLSGPPPILTPQKTDTYK